jgi:selenocysteine-specific translation elongation factor
MAVVATAGHVDHGKSTLVRLLTGREPDRWAEERRRGLTIDLGYAWTDIAGRLVSLVDVPGHEHFTGNMLAGLGPVRAVMFVVAADDGWCPQSQEHARAIAALGIEHVLLVVTRCDLAPGEPATHDARERFAALGVQVAETVLVSGATGAGMPNLRAALGRLAEAAAPRTNAEPAGADVDPDGASAADTGDEPPVRLWVDRSFTVRGAGAVVTGTLEAGTLRADDALLLRGRRITVRGLQSCDEQVEVLSGPARVAVNLRGLAATEVYRGDALLAESWPPAAALVDVTGPEVGARLPRELTLHVGTAALTVRTQRLPDGMVRLRLPRPVPLVPGDRAVLRDPGLHEVLAGVQVAVVDPPTRRDRRRGEAQAARPAPPVRPAPEAPDGILGLVDWLGAHPLQAPSHDQLDAWSFTSHDLARAADRGEVLRLGGVVLAGDALHRATVAIGQLAQPFTVGEAARAMGTSRRVAVPLLERLDSTLVTRRLHDGSRELRGAEHQPDRSDEPDR